MSTGSVSSIGQQAQQTTAGSDAFKEVDLNDFLKLMITQLRNQDPLNPMENQELLQQITQIREIESNQRLTNTLQSVLLGQSLATASSLLGQTVRGLTVGQEQITGKVDRVSIEDGTAKLHVGDDTIELRNVADILPEGSGDGM
ncbi:MAG TPA: flagellar hook capping FlgD N-terminal domain-containing protein [Thermoguttaceae bacterium]|nr:flagellar hook capping FlgD N-terminal domain-containing protein [Thermoguttaceae bacterium]